MRNDKNFLIMTDKVWRTASTLFNRVWNRSDKGMVAKKLKETSITFF